MQHAVASPSKWYVVVFSTTATYIGEMGAVMPTTVLPAYPLFVTSTWRLETTAGTGGTADVWRSVGGHGPNVAPALSTLQTFLRGKRIITTVATDASRALVETFTGRLFTMLNVASTMVVGKALACSFAAGHERLRVIDFGWEALTCSFVVSGVTEESVSSRSLGMCHVFSPSEIAAASTIDITKEKWSQVLVLIGGKEDPRRSPLHRLLKQLSRESRGVSTIITGDALEIGGLFVRVSQWLSEAEPPMRSSSATADHRACVIEAVHSRPALLHFTGASMVASLCRLECEKAAISKEEFAQHGHDVVHWRCPGVNHCALDQAAVEARTQGGTHPTAPAERHGAVDIAS